MEPAGKGGACWPGMMTRPSRRQKGFWLLWNIHPGAMVHAFLIHTLRAPNLEDTGLCRVLYSYVFGAEKSPDDPRPHGAERDRLFRKEQILAVARWSHCADCSSKHLDVPPQTCSLSSQMSLCPCMRPLMEPSTWELGTLSRSHRQWCGWVCSP
ncbi:AP-5 complex subunit sigma-1 isoform X3 [Peromyscus maniculatus bairdii]|uniref:AP-5 complex subunit sigma-1 isoform X3 n=1 Tax=Peromyscus maniculatus bairdii TaxID=230844 RepID=UPI003FD4A89D